MLPLPRTLLWMLTGALSLSGAPSIAATTEVELLSTPVKVTATVETDHAGYTNSAQIGVHNGPIAQLISTHVRGKSIAEITSVLKQQVVWRAPYLFVHSSCGGGSAWRCEGETVFKVSDDSVVRLGDLIGVDATAVYRDGHFFDLYDKLEMQVDGLSQARSPRFNIALNDINGVLVVNPEITWSRNAADWRTRAEMISSTHPAAEWSEAEWESYFSAVVNNAALARYCSHTDELQALLKQTESQLDAYHRRALADALSKVISLERPKVWRTPY